MFYIRKSLKKMKSSSIAGVVLLFTIILSFISVIIGLVNSIIILAKDWKNKKLNDSKILWGLLSLLLLGPIGTLVFACIGINTPLEEKTSNISTQQPMYPQYPQNQQMYSETTNIANNSLVNNVENGKGSVVNPEVNNENKIVDSQNAEATKN